MASSATATTPTREEVVPSRKRIKLPPWLEVAKPRLIPLLLATTLGGMALTEGWPLSSPRLVCTLGGGALAAGRTGPLPEGWCLSGAMVPVPLVWSSVLCVQRCAGVRCARAVRVCVLESRVSLRVLRARRRVLCAVLCCAPVCAALRRRLGWQGCAVGCGALRVVVRP